MSALVIGADYRIVRVIDPGMLEPHARAFRSAVQFFVRKAKLAQPWERVHARLLALIDRPDAGLWLALTPTYTLLGFVGATLTEDAWGDATAFLAAAVLHPRETPRDAGPALFAAMETWAREHGAVRILWGTQRAADHRAWTARFGAHEYGTLWAKEITQ